MARKPVLVLQMRRMGDVILSYPMLRDLSKIYLNHPLAVVGQPVFTQALSSLCPDITFLPPAALSQLQQASYEAIINLGGETASALFTARASAQLKLGKIQTGATSRINGFWHLYRESLAFNNRHNIFHWADLFRLDLPQTATETQPSPVLPVNSKRIGLFIGASEPVKRPDPKFWATLCKRIVDLGYKPILLGGQAEKGAGKQIIQLGAPAIDFIGKTSVLQLGGILKTLDLLVTPDTGPMHLADLLGVRVLNLSMGNVNAHETGPYGCGQRILRASMSCVGCWQCKRGFPVCKSRFTPASVAGFISALLLNQSPPAQAGLELLATTRDDIGLHKLNGAPRNLNFLLNEFWKVAFLYFGSRMNKDNVLAAARNLAESSERVVIQMRKTLQSLFKNLAISQKKRHIMDDSFWRSVPFHTRLFAGNAHMNLQNGDFSTEEYLGTMERIATLQEILDLS